MNLKEWVSQKRGRIVWLAKQLQVSQPTVSDYVSDRVPVEQAPLIELLTERQVTCEEMCPHMRWDVLRVNPVPIKAGAQLPAPSPHPAALAAQGV